MPAPSIHLSRHTGRPPQVELPEQDRDKLRNLYVRTNRNRAGGSRILAARLLARAGELSAPVAEAILKPRAGNALPDCIANAMHAAPQVFARQRNRKDADLRGVYCPGALRMVEDPETGLRRLHPGERQSWDDATINFGVCIPWPWGGDKCADKYGVKLGRFQLLTCVDDATDYCPGFSFVIREQQSYRAEDVAAAQFRLATRTYQPLSYMLEGGAWQAARSRAFHAAAGIRVEDATGRPNSKLVEGFFNRLWSVLSPLPGNVGRWRGEQKAESDLYLRCRQGVEDPRRHFAPLNQALEDLGCAIHYLNTTPAHSSKYGSWVPQELHNHYLADHPLPRMDAALAHYAAPVCERRTVRRGMIQLTCRSPYGESFRYHFAEESLWQYEGAEVRVYFDPWSEHELQAAVVLEQAWHGIAAGTLLCNAVCVEDAPQVRLAAEGIRVELAGSRAIEQRRLARAAVRREHRVIGEQGKVESFASELRAPGLLQTIQSITAPDPFDQLPEQFKDAAKTASREDWRDGMPERLAAAEEEEAKARRRGELLPA